MGERRLRIASEAFEDLLTFILRGTLFKAKGVPADIQVSLVSFDYEAWVLELRARSEEWTTDEGTMNLVCKKVNRDDFYFEASDGGTWCHEFDVSLEKRKNMLSPAAVEARLMGNADG
jgi:hypothetical protein